MRADPEEIAGEGGESDVGVSKPSTAPRESGLPASLRRVVERDDLLSQAVKFGISGVPSAASYTATIVALVELAGWHTVLATTAGFVVGTSVSYTLNSLFTFNRKLEGRAFGRFWVITAIGWCVNVSIVEGAQWVGLHYGFGIFGSLVVAPTFNFLGHRFWTFRKSEPA